MEPSAEPRMPLPKYCSVAATLKSPSWAGAAPCWDFFTCPFAVQAPWLGWHIPLTRYASYHPCLHIVDSAWQRPGWLGRVGDAADTWVLARRGPDGFYYWAQIKAAPELERQGALLVEFEVPIVTDPQLPAQRQSVVLEEDVIRFLPCVEYSPRPGDKVLAPWEPDQQRYGPGTVLLGLEPGDPLRASKEGGITVHFWNGKIATVPLGRVRWVPPAVWKKAVERLHKPLTREHPGPLFWAPCCSLLGPVAGCVISRPPPGTLFLCPPYLPHACCQLLCQTCLCCCPWAGPTWWPLARTSGATAREHPEVEVKPTAQLLPLESPEEEEVVAVEAPMGVSSSSSSSSSEEEDLENDLELGFPQSLEVDSTVNMDPILFEKSLRRQGGLCQPEWRYWRRTGCEPSPGKPGTRRGNIWTEERGGKQQSTNPSGGEDPGAGPGSKRHEATTEPAREGGTQKMESGKLKE
uniref:Chromosome 11 open reading frame 16 n=1 Tax=Suricata suricatta TaxID=37032 RepID=A0A673U2K8_SURSU